MSSNILALFFVFVMLGIGLFNRRSEFKSRPPENIAASVATAPSSSPKISPPSIGAPTPFASPTTSPPPVSGPSPSPEPVLQNYVVQRLQEPNLLARSYLLVGSTRGVITEKNSKDRVSVASVSKLMTALVFTELFPEEVAVRISQTAMALGGNSHGLVTGDVLTKREALEFLLIASNNVVAEAIKETLGGEDFVRNMNRRALDMGMAQSLFVDPTGLTPLNRSSARDLAIFLQYLDKNFPAILDITRSPNIALAAKSGRTYNLQNTNLLLGYRPGIIGGKTGYTDAAGGCLVLVFEKAGERFYAVVLGSSDRFADMQKLIRYAE